MPLCAFVKLQRRKLDNTILLRGIGDVDSLVDRKTRDLSKLMVDMGSNGTDTVRTEGEPLGLPPVSLPESLDAVHSAYSLAFIALVCSS